MEMTPQEIAKEYREAKDKGNQIKILADENLTDRKEIVKILKEQGEITDKVPRARGARAKAEKGTEASDKVAAVVKEVAAVHIPESVKHALEREMVNMQNDIDSKKDDIKKLKEHIDDIKHYIEKKEDQMKEIMEFCRKEGGENRRGVNQEL